jgi:hypothetical protein
MTNDPVIAAVAAEYADFSFLGEGGEPVEQADPFAQYCADSKAFWRYTDDVLNKYVRGATDPMRLAQAKVLATDRYLDYRAYASKAHRDKIGEKGHICLYQVWIAAMHEIRTRQLALDPPKVIKIVTPKPEPKPASGSYAVLPPAVFLGKWEE